MEKIKTIFRSKPKLMVGLVIALALSLPFVINQVLKQQDVRQRADTAPAISLNFSPQSNSTPIVVGSTFEVSLLLNTAPNEDIGALQFLLGYDTAKLSAPTIIKQDTALKIIYNAPVGAGKYAATMINTNLNPKVTGNNLNVITFKFTALAAGESKIFLDSTTKATAATYSTYVPITNSNGIIGTYTITTPIDSSATPTVTTTTAPSPTQAVATSPTPTNTPTPSPTPTTAPTPLPTATPIPIPTIGSDQTGLKVSLALPGIGTKTNLGEKNAPNRATRVATAIVLDSSNTPVTTEKTGVLTYSTTTGRYDGYISLGSSIATQSGSYIVKIKMDNTLYKRTPGIVTINKLSPDNTVPAVELVSGDLTGPNNTSDNTLDILDYNLFQACYRGQAACTTAVAQKADFNDDGVVKGDDIDANILSRGFYIRNGD